MVFRLLVDWVPKKKRGARWDVCKVLYIRGKLMYFVLSRFYGHQSKQFGISMGFCCKCKFCYRKNWMLNRKEKKRNQHTNQRRKRDGQYDSHAMLKNTWVQAQWCGIGNEFAHAYVCWTMLCYAVLCRNNRLNWSMNRIDFTMTDIGLTEWVAYHISHTEGK